MCGSGSSCDSSIAVLWMAQKTSDDTADVPSDGRGENAPETGRVKGPGRRWMPRRRTRRSIVIELGHPRTSSAARRSPRSARRVALPCRVAGCGRQPDDRIAVGASGWCSVSRRTRERCRAGGCRVRAVRRSQMSLAYTFGEHYTGISVHDFTRIGRESVRICDEIHHCSSDVSLHCSAVAMRSAMSSEGLSRLPVS